MNYINKYHKFDAALEYTRKHGWAIIPTKNVDGKKVPAIASWKQYQSVKPTVDEIHTWWIENLEYNPALVTGMISGVAVIDFDLTKDTKRFTEEALELMGKLPETLIAQSGSGGRHYFFKTSKVIPSKIGILPGVDIKGEGGYLVLPPSVHSSGNKYQFINKHEMAEFPYELLEKPVDREDLNIENSKSPIVVKIKEGERNKTLTSIAGTIYSMIPDKPDLAKRLVIAMNDKICDPALSLKELENTILSSMEKYHPNPNGDNENVLRLIPLTASELLSKKCQEQTWLVDGLVPENALTLISGAPGSFKTWITLEIAKNVAKGTKLFDTFNTVQGGVLYVDEENGEYTMQQRVKLLGIDESYPFYTLSLAGFTANEDYVDLLIKTAKERECKLVIFDPLVSIHNRDENNSGEMRKVFNHLKTIAKSGLTVICIHHNRKDGFLANNPAQSVRGSSDIVAAVDSCLSVDRKGTVINIKQPKLRQGEEVKPFQAEFMKEENLIKFKFHGEIEESLSQREEAEEIIVNILKSSTVELNIKQIAERITAMGINIGRNSVGDAVDALELRGVIKTRRGPRNSKLCSINDQSETINVDGIEEENDVAA